MNKRFKNLYELIISRENILLAYRNIKKNKGHKIRRKEIPKLMEGFDHSAFRQSKTESFNNVLNKF